MRNQAEDQGQHNLKESINRSKEALYKQDYETVYSEFHKSLVSDADQFSSGLLMLSMKATLAEYSLDSAWKFFDKYSHKLTLQQQQNAIEQFTIYAAQVDIKKNNFEEAIQLIEKHTNWIKPNYRILAIKILINAYIKSNQAKLATNILAKELITIKDNNEVAELISTVIASSQSSSVRQTLPAISALKTVPKIARNSVVWDSKQLTEALPDLKQISGPKLDIQIESVTYHKSSIQPGALFIPAIKADTLHKDGTPDRPAVEQLNAVKEAAFLGASAAIVDQYEELDFPEYIPVFACTNRTEAFKQLAKTKRKNLVGDVIGITGSYGKTTTRELISQILSFFEVTSTQVDNRNAISGICETLSSTPSYVDTCVLELGISIPNTMEELVNIANPSIPIILDVSDSHLGNYKNQKELLTEKFKILKPTSFRKTALISSKTISLAKNLNINFLNESKIDYWSVGESLEDDIQLISYTNKKYGSQSEIRVFSETLTIELPYYGRHLHIACCYTLGIAQIKGWPLQEVTKALSSYRPIEVQRGTRWRLSSRQSKSIIEIIDDSQNASPTTTFNLIDTLNERNAKRTILVMGDMLDLGPKSKVKHTEVAEYIAQSNINVLITVGTETKTINELLKNNIKTYHFDSTEDAGRVFGSILQNGDLIALKGSNKIQLSRLINYLQGEYKREIIRSLWTIESSQ